MALPHTGAAGFEGLVRDALAELTGQGFRLMKSGPQGGVDMIGDPSGSGLVLGMEGKHYRAETRLPLDGLKSKLRDAADTFRSMDVWLLATTRAIDGGDADDLRKLGADLGVEVTIMDWGVGGAVPPRLATLCAAATGATSHHLGPSVAGDIAAVRANSFFQSEAARLRDDLRSASIGLAAAREALRYWTRAQMRDGNAARQAFDSYATLEEAGTARIVRESIDVRLDAWWNGRRAPAAVLIGQEGMGKTWAALAWWLERTRDGSDFPLTLVVPARDVHDADGPALVAAALHRATGLRDAAFWRRRLERWASLELPGPFLLIIVDGLNQNWSFTGWSDLLVSLATPRWAGRVAFALTCRPDHWTERLKSLSECPVEREEIAVGPFDDEELDALLAQHGLRRDQLLPDILALVRVPRISNLAIVRRNEVEGGEITPERLVYEDWRHRHHRAQQAFSHADFKAFVSDLGRDLDGRLGPPLTRAELLDRLGGGTGVPRERFEGVLSELVDGGWLETGGGRSGFRLRDDRVPAALGLVLLDDLRRATSDADREETLARRLDPLQDSDLAVAIRRHAATFALLDPSATDKERRLLLDGWTKSQNFSPRDFESFWRLIGLAPALFLDLAQAAWFESRGRSREDETFVKGFANAWRWADVASEGEARLARWFSRYWLDPLVGEVLGQVRDDEHAERRREATRARVGRAASAVGRAFGLELVEVDPEGQAWGSYRAVEMLSWLAREPLVRVFTAWALTRAILGGWRQFEAMAWVLRWNEQDAGEAEEALLGRAEELLARGDAISRDAARSLLDALASPRAIARRESEFGPQSAAPPPPPVWHASSRSRPEDEEPLAAVLRLKVEPCDPDLELPQAWVERLNALADATGGDTLLRNHAERGGLLDDASLPLARWAPHRLADVRRRFADAAARASVQSEKPGGWARLFRRLGLGRAPVPVLRIVGAEDQPGALPILGERELAAWRSIGRLARAQGLAPDFARDAALFADASAGEQIRLLAPSSPASVPDSAWRVLRRPSPGDLTAIAAELDPAGDAATLSAWLGYVERVCLPVVPQGWSPLAALVGHQDAVVRTRLLSLLWELEDESLADAFERTGWTYSAGMGRDEAALGSLVLTLSAEATAGRVGARVHPDAFGELSARHPGIRSYRDAFADHVFSEIEHLQTARSRAFPRAILGSRRGWDLLLEDHGSALMSWTRPFTHPEDDRADWMFIEEFPYLRALEAVDAIAPGSLARALLAGLRASEGSNMRSGDLYRTATRVQGPLGEEVRQLVLAEANDDAKLFEFACGLQENGQTDWLIASIVTGMASGSPGIVARALTLAGFLLPDEHAVRLWEGVLALPPAGGWLTDVHAAARERYARFAWARHWNGRLQGTAELDVAHAAHRLLVECIDDRFFIGAHRPSAETLAGWPWRKAFLWTYGWKDLQAAAKKNKTELAKTFLGSRPPLANQFPRRR